MQPETCKIASSDTETGYIIINKCDFDPKNHELYDADKKPEGGKGEKDGDKDKGTGSKDKKPEGGKGEK